MVAEVLRHGSGSMRATERIIGAATAARVATTMASERASEHKARCIEVVLSILGDNHLSITGYYASIS
jgi:hypothetical protein